MEYWIQKSPDSPASGPYSLDQVQKLIRQKKWRPDWKASPDGRSFLSFSSVFANLIAKFEQEEADREKLESEEQNRKQLELDRKEQLRKEAQRAAAILEAEKTRPVAPRSASNDKANDGYDFRTMQELLCHADLCTTMIYTQVLNRGSKGVRCTADGLEIGHLAVDNRPNGDRRP